MYWRVGDMFYGLVSIQIIGRVCDLSRTQRYHFDRLAV